MCSVFLFFFEWCCFRVLNVFCVFFLVRGKVGFMFLFSQQFVFNRPTDTDNVFFVFYEWMALGSS